jgi:hypothetical protein
MWSTFGVHEPFFHKVYSRLNVMNALNAMQAGWMAGLIAKSIEAR